MSKLPLSQLSQVVASLSLNEQLPVDKLAVNIAAYLLEEHRVGELDSLVREIQQDWADNGYVDVIARVARPINNQLTIDLASPFKRLYPSAKQVRVTPVIDHSVVGGAVLELGQQRLDLSIARRLNRFKNAINEKGN